LPMTDRARGDRAAMGTKGETYADIKLGSKDGGMMGTLKCRPDGIVWESQVRVASSCGALRLRPFLPRACAHSCSAARLVQARDRKVWARGSGFRVQGLGFRVMVCLV